MSNHLFALDIGTRSVVGIILKENNEVYHVEDLVTIEHKERSMIDGQIHNILSVANVISEIKSTLEERHGPLNRVSVAAAGRALKTTEGSMTIDISEKSLFSTEDINRLELAAVQQAQQSLLSSSATTDDYYYCVGYSVLHYKLDGDDIGSLIDQSGRSATASVIATFLPRVVVESLLSALKRADLEMEALTLEPIAAINVLIPPSMRRLNVALVDIGAGTSDIAITDNNTVIAYGMVPVAGDEVTEALSNHYLLDFPIAELAKRSLSSEDSIQIVDILGFEQTIPSDEVISFIQPAIDKLATSISQEIRKLNNGRSPQAVMVVGGGSLTPGLTKEISARLELPENRVGIRGLEALSNVTLSEEIVSSPALVTPIGIAIAARRAPIHYMTVMVNDKTIRLFELKEMTVGDALLATNIKAKQLYGKPGLGMSITLNGDRVIIPGEHGHSSVILLNGKIASTKDFIKNGDIISLEPSIDGRNATATIKDLIGDIQPIHITINEKPVAIKPEIIVNGLLATSDHAVVDRDEISFTFQTNLQAILTNEAIETEQPFELFINNQRIRMKEFTPRFMLGNKPILPSYQLKDGDAIRIIQPKLPSVEEVIQIIGKSHRTIVSVTFNGVPVDLHSSSFTILLNGQTSDHTTIIKPGDVITFSEAAYKQAVFSDVFKYIEYTLPQAGTSSYQLLRNGETIGFNDPIYENDALEITFSPKKVDS
ncbi:cell division protein FtsA [Sporosarcina oncorhynchi]|uniref:Cell division protein FtsA n=1 Tax=Sporosarcina oncorhynchi TaxID=3056444 RepID=A0ABZ0LAH8_9BACL|nr:cell division protein FtsA [Sporosarcina sp. T2O-4]WOV88564.1 cell division protein FtsA [Sporosarcina sp. T2O-4]